MELRTVTILSISDLVFCFQPEQTDDLLKLKSVYEVGGY